MSKPVITLVSDFGDKFSESQLELVIHSINPDVKFIVGENNITPFSILEGAFVISKFFTFAPQESVHIGVVDPGVGSERRGLIVKTKNYWFVGPDNGLFYPAAKADGIEATYYINEAVVGSLSNTFHGRDVFAKVASYISLGKSPEEFATPCDKDKIVSLEFDKNQAVYVDPYCNIKINAGGEDFEIGKKYIIALDKKEIVAPYCRTFADVEEGEYLLYQGSHQTLELAQNLRSAAENLDIKSGDVLQIQKVPSRQISKEQYIIAI